MENYKKLFKLFKTYQESDWYNLITNVFNFIPLELPLNIESDYPQETLIYIDKLLRYYDKKTADYYVGNLIDYYSTLNNNSKNISYFKIFHSIFATLKPTIFRYVLEYKLTKEDFLNKFDEEEGEDLQIDLISTLSNLRYIKDETTTSYLFNNISKYSSKYYILISLRYFQRSSNVPTYYEYLNQLVEEKLSENNVDKFVESFKELIFQKKSFKILYNWYKNNNRLKISQLAILNKEMRKWLNYSNKYMNSKNYPYAKLLFFEINKEYLIPCITLKNISSYIRRIPEIQNILDEYINPNLFSEYFSSNKEWQKLSIYRIEKEQNKLFIQKDTINISVLEKLSEMYSLDEDKILKAELTKEESELFETIIKPIVYNNDSRKIKIAQMFINSSNNVATA